jgi:hypothetical protein
MSGVTTGLERIEQGRAGGRLLLRLHRPVDTALTAALLHTVEPVDHHHAGAVLLALHKPTAAEG